MSPRVELSVPLRSPGRRVAGSLPALVEDGRLDVARTVAAVPALVEAGVTDVRLALRLPGDLWARQRGS